MRALVIRRQTLKRAASPVPLEYLDDLAIALNRAAPGEIRHRFHNRFHLCKDQRRLQLVIGCAVNLAPRLTFRTEQMAQCQSGEQPRLAVATWLRLDCNLNPTPPGRTPAGIDTRREPPSSRQQLHPLACKHAFRDRQRLKKRDHPLDTRKPLLFPSYAFLGRWLLGLLPNPFSHRVMVADTQNCLHSILS